MDACDIAVAGGGAAGLAAAIFAAEARLRSGAPARICVLDGAARLGAKILISGGGRCNVTHREVTPGDFNGPRPVIRNVLAAFDVPATRRWFASMGVQLKEEPTGKLFPVSDSARTVLDALLRRCRVLGISISTQARVVNVRREETDGAFVIEHAQGTLHARSVVMATGGRSLPRTGSDGSGWNLVRTLGHTVTDTYPALVPLVLKPEMFHAELSGVSQLVELSTFTGGKLMDRRAGSLLWTHFGISGPVVLDASRHWTIANATGSAPELRCSFVPGESFARMEEWLLQSAAERPRRSVAHWLGAKLPERFALALTRWTGCDPGTQLAQLGRATRRALLHALTEFPLPIERARGWDYAEVTAGGVPLDEIEYHTMQSRKVPGLYLIGEMLDCDGRIGGFNFQWAWSTGYIAGRAAAEDGTARG